MIIVVIVHPKVTKVPGNVTPGIAKWMAGWTLGAPFAMTPHAGEIFQ
jgi:hypothetical protein